MRRLLGLGLALGLVWCGWWFLGALALERATEAGLAEARARGWQADHAGLTVEGFPARFEVSLAEPALADARQGLGWRGPDLRLSLPAWAPWRLAAHLPERQEITTTGQRLTIEGPGIEARLALVPSPDLALEATALRAGPVTVSSDLGWSLQAAEAEATTVQAGDAAQHAFTLDLRELRLEGRLAEAAARLAQPDLVALFRAEGEAGFSAPLDRHARETQPALVSLALREMQIDWGELSGGASGTLVFDPEGVPEGRIDLSLAGWRRAVELAVEAGLIHPDAAQTWERMGGMLALASGGERVEMPLVFAGGRMSLGPLPLGPAPRLPQRQ